MAWRDAPRASTSGLQWGAVPCSQGRTLFARGFLSTMPRTMEGEQLSNQALQRNFAQVNRMYSNLTVTYYAGGLPAADWRGIQCRWHLEHARISVEADCWSLPGSHCLGTNTSNHKGPNPFPSASLDYLLGSDCGLGAQRALLELGRPRSQPRLFLLLSSGRLVG